jgi:uncharacterized protein
MSVLDVLLADVPRNWRVSDVYVGENWIISLTCHADGTIRAGVATAPKSFLEDAAYSIGHHQPKTEIGDLLQLLRSDDATAAGVALATLNALQQSDNFLRIDAADWLSQQSRGKNVAVFGRFPFVEEEVHPFAKNVFVFEQHPEKGEYAADAMANILPQADIVAITGSTVVNHTIDSILQHIPATSITALLGPSTPMTARLFDCGIHALFGVRVADIQQAVASVQAGVGFQKMHGLERVSLFKPYA